MDGSLAPLIMSVAKKRPERRPVTQLGELTLAARRLQGSAVATYLNLVSAGCDANLGNRSLRHVSSRAHARAIGRGGGRRV